MNLEGVILRVTPYKESGAMINVLTKDEVLSFYARNIYKVNNQNILLTTPLMYANFTFADRKSPLTFKELSPILDTRNYMNDFHKLAAIDFLNEVTIRLFNENEMNKIYPFLVETLKLININKNIYVLLATYLATSLKLNGFGLYVDGCVLTRSKNNIVAISYNDGGLICKAAYRSSRHKLYSVNKINLVRTIFKIGSSDLEKLNFSQRDTKEVLADLLLYTYNQTGIRLKSEKLLKL